MVTSVALIPMPPPIVGISVISIVGFMAVLALLLVFIAKRRRDNSEARSKIRRKILKNIVTAPEHEEIPHTIAEVVELFDLDSNESQVDILFAFTGDHNPVPSPRVMQELTEALHSRGFPEILARQTALTYPIHRRGVATLLGSLPMCRIPTATLAEKLSDPDIAVRLAAAAALERVADEEATQYFIRALEESALPLPRIIERIGHPWAASTCIRELESLADSPIPQENQVRVALARALGLSASPEAIPVLSKLQEQGNAEERIQSVRSLSLLYDVATSDERTHIIETARHIVKNADQEPGILVHLAVQTVALGADPKDIPLLVPLARHSDWHVRRSASRALLPMGEAGIVALHEIAEGDDRYAADRAREELTLAGHVGEPLENGENS